MISFTWKIPKSPIFNEKLAKPFLESQRAKIFSKILPVYQAGIILKAPVGATARLRNSIQMKVTTENGSVFTDLAYAVPVNDGRAAAPVAESADASLSAWIRRSAKGQAFFAGLKARYPKITLQGAIFILKRSKKEKPTPGQSFFEAGVEAVAGIVENTYQRILADFAAGIQ